MIFNKNKAQNDDNNEGKGETFRAHKENYDHIHRNNESTTPQSNNKKE